MRFLVETKYDASDPIKNTIHIIEGSTLEQAMTDFIRNYPHGVNGQHTISEIKNNIGNYTIGVALLPVDDIPF